MTSSEARKLESIKFAQESAKQIITLSTAIVTFIFGAVSVGALTLHDRAFWLVLIVLFLLVVSVVAGIVTLFALSGILSSQNLFSSEEPLNSDHYKRFGRVQFFAFVGAVIAISGIVLFWPTDRDCPSSDNLRQMAARTTGWTGSSDFSLGSFLLMLQATFLYGVAFDPFSFQQDCLAAPEVYVGRC